MCLAVPGQVVAIVDPERRLGIVEVGGVRREVDLTFVVDDAHPVEACLGAWVLLHVGFAMSRLDPDEAERTLALFAALGEGAP